MSLGDSCLISKFCPRSEPYLSKYQNTVPRSYTLRQLSNSSFVKIRPWEAAVVEVYLWTTIFAIDHHWKWRNKHSFTLYSRSPMISWGWQPTYTPLYEFWNYIFFCICEVCTCYASFELHSQPCKYIFLRIAYCLTMFLNILYLLLC